MHWLLNLKSVFEIAEIIRNELNSIVKTRKMLERSEQLKQLYKQTKSEYNIPCFNQFLEGIWKYHAVQEKRKKITSISDYSQGKQARENIIASDKDVQYLLNQASEKLDQLDIPPELKNYFGNYIRKYTYYSKMQMHYQQTIIFLHEGQFDKAKKEAEAAIGDATISEDRCQFAGLKFESEAYLSIIEKRWWEIRNVDFRDAAKLVSKALECYNRCKSADKYEFQNKVTSIPQAIASLLSFISAPTFDNIHFLAQFTRIRDTYPAVQYAFRPTTESSSQRKKQRDLIMQYLQNEVYKTAAFNIFEEFRTMVVDLERFAHNNENVYKKISPKRASIYQGRHPPAIENFIEDCIETFGERFPQSVGELKNIYHDCKHKKVYVTLTPEPDKFANELVNTILEKYAVMKNVKDDINNLKCLFTTG